MTKRSKQDPQFFTGSLWLMEFGSLQVRVQVDGAHGKGELSVPVPAIAQRAMQMSKPLAALLFCLMTILAFGAVAIATAGAREAELVPGAKPTKSSRRRARIVMVAASISVFALLYGGRRWWDARESGGQCECLPGSANVRHSRIRRTTALECAGEETDS